MVLGAFLSFIKAFAQKIENQLGHVIVIHIKARHYQFWHFLQFATGALCGIHKIVMEVSGRWLFRHFYFGSLHSAANLNNIRSDNSRKIDNE